MIYPNDVISFKTSYFFYGTLIIYMTLVFLLTMPLIIPNIDSDNRLAPHGAYLGDKPLPEPMIT